MAGQAAGAGPARPGTFLFADLAGFTALTEAHGDEHAADVAAAFCDDLRGLLHDADAVEVKTIGDAMSVHFRDASTAVEFGRHAVVDVGGRHGALAVRVGMHTGTAVPRGRDWFGATVNIAARVTALAHPGQVLLTEATHRGSRGVEAIEVGERTLRNVREPVALWALQLPPSGAVARDPVCRMALDTDQPDVLHVEVLGRRVAVCSADCADVLRAAPSVFLDRR